MLCRSASIFYEKALVSYRLSAVVRPGRDVKAFGLTVGGQRGDGGGCELRFEPAAGHVQWGSSRRGKAAERVPAALDCRSTFARDRGGDFALDRVEGLSEAFELDLIVRLDARSGITLIDACIDGRRTMITHRCDLRSDRLSLFCWDGEIRLDPLVVRPLVE